MCLKIFFFGKMTSRLFGLLSKVKEGVKVAAKRLNQEEEDDEEEEEYEEEYEEEEEEKEKSKEKETKNVKKEESDDSLGISDIDLDMDEVDALLEENEKEENISSPKKNQIDPEIRKNFIQKAPFLTGIKKLSGLFPAQKILENPDLLIEEISKVKEKQQNLISRREELDKMLDGQRSLSIVVQNLEKEKENLKKLNEKALNLNTELEKVNKMKIAARSKASEREQIIKENKEKIKKFKERNAKIQEEIKQLKIEYLESQGKLTEQTDANIELQEQIQKLKADVEKANESSAGIRYELDDEQVKLRQVLEQLQTLQSESSEEKQKDEDNEIEELQKQLISEKMKMEKLQKVADDERGDIEVSDLEKKLAELNEKHQLMTNKSQNNASGSEKSSERDEVTHLLVSYFKGEEGAEDNLAKYFGWTEEQMASMKEEKAGLWEKGVKLFTAFRDSWSSWLLSSIDNS